MTQATLGWRPGATLVGPEQRRAGGHWRSPGRVVRQRLGALRLLGETEANSRGIGLEPKVHGFILDLFSIRFIYFRLMCYRLWFSVSGSFFIKHETKVILYLGNVIVEIVSLRSKKTLSTMTLLFSVFSPGGLRFSSYLSQRNSLGSDQDFSSTWSNLTSSIPKTSHLYGLKRLDLRISK